MEVPALNAEHHSSVSEGLEGIGSISWETTTLHAFYKKVQLQTEC